MIKPAVTPDSSFPEHLQILVSNFNGGMPFLDSFIGLSIEEIKSEQAKVGKRFIPFAKDENSGNL